MESSSIVRPPDATSPSPRVFICSEVPSLDFSPARKFGTELIAVFPPGQVSLSPQVALSQARKVLRDMMPEDYLVLCGDPVKIGICVQVAAERVGTLRLLRWNRHQPMGYDPIEVNFFQRG